MHTRDIGSRNLQAILYYQIIWVNVVILPCRPTFNIALFIINSKYRTTHILSTFMRSTYVQLFRLSGLISYKDSVWWKSSFWTTLYSFLLSCSRYHQSKSLREYSAFVQSVLCLARSSMLTRCWLRDSYE